MLHFRWSSWYGTELEPRCQVPEEELEDMRMIGRETKDILDKHSKWFVFILIFIYFYYVIMLMCNKWGKFFKLQPLKILTTFLHHPVVRKTKIF